MTDLPDLLIYVAAAGAILAWTLLVAIVSLLIARLTPLKPEEPAAVKGELDLLTDEELQDAA